MKKLKTHSGAKKRYRALKSGKIKRKSIGRRHMLECKNAKRKHNLSRTAYVSDADMTRARACLVK